MRQDLNEYELEPGPPDPDDLCPVCDREHCTCPPDDEAAAEAADYNRDDPAFSEPEPEDYTITDRPRGGYDVAIVEGKFLGNFKSYSEAQLAVRADMDANQFWPNVWTISDHGNASLVQLTV